MEQPLVSVITITRNRGKLLGRCISSVLGQTYKNIEHIVVDGASDDETDEVVSSFKDERIRYIKLDYNWPVVQTINYAISLSKGEYVTFLDSDDEYIDCKIEKQLNHIISLPLDYGMVYCWMSYFDNTTGKFLYNHATKLRGMVVKEAVEKYTVSGTPTFFFRSSVIKELGGWRDEGIITDWELGARCCAKWKVDYVPESLVKVYINHGSQRMSDLGYYKNLSKKEIQFHEYMLNEFSDIFKKYPRAAKYHYFKLTNAYAWVNDKQSTRKYFYKHLLCFPNVNDLLTTLKSLIIGRK